MKNLKLEDCLDNELANGRCYFNLQQVRELWGISDSSFRQQASTLLKKGKIALIRNGFYTIVSPEYRVIGAPPVTHYIDGMMKYLNRNYYVGLLNAAAWYGAAHQQPQSYNIIIQPPYLPDIKKKHASIHFVYKKEWKKEYILKKETSAGYFNIASPELTAMDLCSFSKHAGGINNVATVLNELCDEIELSKLLIVAEHYNNLVAIQRLGFIFDYLGKASHANALQHILIGKKFFPAKLEASSKKMESKVTGNVWKIIVNEKLEIDE
jgi:predicted transcriptional regulator of viral defense system